VLVRAARPEDAGPLALCHLACWREAYTGMVDPDPLATAVAAVDRRTAGWRQILAGNHGTLVAEDDGELVGFAAAGPGRDEDLDLTTELYALYGRRAYWGQGLGHRLVTAVLGDADSFLWVFRDNARARDFYARHGAVQRQRARASARSDRGRLRDPDGVARRVAERAAAWAPGLVDGLLEDLGAGGAHGLERRVNVVGAEHHHRHRRRRWSRRHR
jgi:GNAT superfamily N-acetyltransferase